MLKLPKNVKITKKQENSDQKCKKIKISKNLPVKIWLSWKHQIAWTKICHTKVLPDKFQEKLLLLVAFASILKKSY